MAKRPAAPAREEPDPAPDESAQPLNKQPWYSRHLWQIQPIRDVLLLLSVFGVLYLGYVLRTVTVPLLLALLLAYLLEPVVCRLEKSKHFTRQGAVSGILVAVVVFVAVPAALATAFAVVQGVSFAQTVVDSVDRITTVSTYVKDHEDNVLPRYDREEQTIAFFSVEPAPEFEEGPPAPPDGIDDEPEQDSPALVETRLNTAASLKAERAFDGLPDVLKPVVYGYARRTVTTTGTGDEVDGPVDTVAQLSDWALGIVRGNAARMTDAAVEGGRITLATGLATVTTLGMLLFGLFLTGFFFYFLSTGYAHVRGFGYEVLPHRYRDQIVDLLRQMDRVVAGFVRGRITIAIIQSVIFTILYWLIGVPAPLIFGPLVGILSIVPYVALLGIPMTIIALAIDNSGWFAFQQTWWWTLAAPVAIYFAGQAVDDYLLTPAIQGKATNMDTPTILFASLAGGILAGIYGLLLAIPVAACVKILLREVFWPRFNAWLRGEEKDFLPLKR
ncbi:MAG: AI-2E family transporter [Phycisphaerales bacterium]